jgi:hypothetical protein
MPLKGHAYHFKSDAELRYIMKDAHDAAKATRGMTAYDPASGRRQDTEGKYLDQLNDASSVLGYRNQGGKQLQQTSNADAAQALMSGLKSTQAPVHPAMEGRHGYNAEAVQNSINSSNRSGRRIGGKEANAIHRLLRGR